MDWKTSLFVLSFIILCDAASECYLWTCIEKSDSDKGCLEKFETERSVVDCGSKDAVCVKKMTVYPTTTSYVYTCGEPRDKDQLGCTKRMHEDVMECFCSGDTCNTATTALANFTLLSAVLLLSLVFTH